MTNIFKEKSVSIDLTKGERVNLAKEAPGLKLVGIGLGWDVNPTITNAEFDLDASVFMLDASGKIPTEKHFVFYNNLMSPDGSVKHAGDNRTGEGDGDDEAIHIDLLTISPYITEIIIVVTIHDAQTHGLHFGQVENSFIRLYDLQSSVEIAKYQLQENFSTETAIEFGRLVKKDGEWRFTAVGSGYDSGLQGFVDTYAA